MIRLFSASLLALAGALVGTAHAEDLAPLAGKHIAVAAAVGVVYYTEEADGFRVVATLSAREGAEPVRFTATLADGQTITVSIPGDAGKDDRAVEISRKGDALSVVEATPLMVRASLQ